MHKDKEIISTSNAPQAIGPYSQAIKANGFIFCSGQIPLKADGTMVNGTIEEETKQVLENLKAVLEAAGSNLKNVMKTTIFLTDMNDFAKVNKVYAMYFTENPPARATIQVSKLPKDSRIEIDAIASA